MAGMWLTILSAFGLLTSISGGYIVESTAKCESYGGECQMDSCDDHVTQRAGRCDATGSKCCVNNTGFCERFLHAECIADDKTCSEQRNLTFTCSDGRACCAKQDFKRGGEALVERLLVKANVSGHDPVVSASSQSRRGKMDGGNRRMMCRRRMKMGRNRKKCRRCKGRKENSSSQVSSNSDKQPVLLTLDLVQSTEKCESKGGQCQMDDGNSCGNDSNPNGKCDEKDSTCCVNDTALCERWLLAECVQNGTTCPDRRKVPFACSDGRACCAKQNFKRDPNRSLLRKLFSSRYDPGNLTSVQLGNTSEDSGTGEGRETAEGKRQTFGCGKGRMRCRRNKGNNPQMRKTRQRCAKHKGMMMETRRRKKKMPMRDMCRKMMQMMMKKMKNKKMKKMTMETDSNSTVSCSGLNGQCVATPDECDSSTSVVAGTCDDPGSVCCASASQIRNTNANRSIKDSDPSGRVDNSSSGGDIVINSGSGRHHDKSGGTRGTASGGGGGRGRDPSRRDRMGGNDATAEME